MCTQVCAGMEYLEKNNCIHCCLAARNCLVTENNKFVKISNFGTSSHGRRNVIHLGSMDSESLLRPPPIKWTAPEVSSTNEEWKMAVIEIVVIHRLIRRAFSFLKLVGIYIAKGFNS